MSTLGKFLDPLADKLTVTAVLVYMVALSRVPAWVVVVIIARDLAVNGLRSVASAQGLVISASDSGKIKTALQLVAVHDAAHRLPLSGAGDWRTVDYQRAGLIVLYRFHGRVAVLDGAVHAQLPVGGAGRGARVGVLAVAALG